MRWLGIFNLLYGGLGLASALYIGRADAIGVCVWVMVVGVLGWCGLLAKAKRAAGRRVAAFAVAVRRR